MLESWIYVDSLVLMVRFNPGNRFKISEVRGPTGASTDSASECGAYDIRTRLTLHGVVDTPPRRQYEDFCVFEHKRIQMSSSSAARDVDGL